MTSVRTVDPAHGAAELLRRLAMALLAIALPCAAFFSRNPAIILLPLGAIILFLATVIDPAEPIGARLRDFARSPGLYVMLGFALWAGATLFWTPFFHVGADRYFNGLATLFLALAALAALPERVRAPTLYLIPIGGFAAVIAACLVSLQARGTIRLPLPADPLLPVRGGGTLALFAPVALGWLLSRGRAPEAIAFAIACASAVYVLGDLSAIVCLGAGLAAFLVARLSPRVGGAALATLAALVLLLGPLIPFAGKPLADALGRPDLAAMFGALIETVFREGARVIAGHGIEMTPRAIAAGVLPASPGAPLLVALWFDLGLIGALLLAVFIMGRVVDATRRPADVVAAEVALACVVAAEMATGVATLQAWFLTTTAAAVIAMRGVARGQFRTRRPRARLFGVRQAAAED